MAFAYRRRRPNSKPKAPSNKKAVDYGIFEYRDPSPSGGTGYHKWTCDKCHMWSIDFAAKHITSGIMRKANRHTCGPVEPDPRFKDS